MQEDLFRFSIVRNPQRFSNEKLSTSVIHLIDEPTAKNYPNYKSLLDVKKKNPKREELIALVHRKVTGGSFTLLKRLSELDTDLVKLNEWLLTQRNIDSVAVLGQLNQLFGALSDLVKTQAFKKDKYIIADSLIVAAVLAPKQAGLRSELMRGRRLIFLIEYLAKGENIDAKTIRKILKATILLPSDLFPIPDNNKALRNKKETAKKDRKDLIKKRTNEINGKLQKLKTNNEAIEELSSAYSKHLFEVKNSSKPNNNKTQPLRFLPTEKFKRLSKTSKEVTLKQGRVNDKMIDVSYVVESIESENTFISKEINAYVDDRTAHDSPNVAVLAEETCGACQVIIIEDKKSENNFTGQTKGEVVPLGMQDLMIVRQEFLKYETSEIAHIENVLKGEIKSKKHRDLHRVEETLVEETEKSEEVEKELETTDRFELQSETSKTISQDTSKDAGVTATGTYGPVTVEAHGNYASNNATEESRTSATSYSKDVVSRSLQKIKERVLKRRSSTDISEIEIINKHEINNTDNNPTNIAGIYHWINKYYNAQVVNYGKRTMLEFMIPEPSAFYRFAQKQKPNQDLTAQKPDEPGFCKKGKFFQLKPTDLTATNYMCFVGKSGVSDIEAPPPTYIVKSGTITQHFSPDSNTAKSGEKSDTISIPTNYKAITAEYVIAVGRGHPKSGVTDNVHSNFGIRITCGNNILLSKQATTHHNATEIDNDGTVIQIPTGDYPFDGELGLDIPRAQEEEILLNDEEGDFNIAMTYASDLYLFAILNVAIKCQRKDNAFKQWQIDTFNAIMNAYKSLKLDYDEAVETQEFQSEISIQGQNPLVNRAIEKAELKKHAISILTGQQYEGFNAMDQDHRQGLGYPEIDLQDAAEEGAFVQFFEQALEWRHITYLFYDYFWGRKEKWVDKIHAKDTDPVFEKFLRAGYARVWIPLRPGFDNAVLHYIHAGGAPWSEKDAPICQEEGTEDISLMSTVAILEELKEQLDNDFTERPGTITVVKGSKKVIGDDETDFTADDVDKEILIHLETYRIAAVENSQEIYLRDAYSGDDENGIGVSLGVKYVGEPWLVEVPTSLVMLQEGGALNG